jgi:class 3 adenylate cyclase/HAMP domain-containing protein
VRLRTKLSIAFFGVSSLLSVLLALFLYRFIERQMTEDLRNHLRDITHVGARNIDLAAYDRLVAQFADDLDEAKLKAIEHSPDYQRLSDQLNAIRSAEPTLIHFAYLLAPTADPMKPKFVADADVLDYLDRIDRGGKLGEHEAISHFNQEYDVSTVPKLARALMACTGQLEQDFVHDDEFDLNSVSAYIPVTAIDGNPMYDRQTRRCIGVLGVDIHDKKMRQALEDAGGLAMKVSLAVIALALLVSITLGTILTRSIHALSDTVKRFAEKDFKARTDIVSRDEIGALGKSFNEMADTIQVHSENLEELVQQRTKELSAEKATSERLLLNVLPGPIADRLKHGESVIVDRFDAVSVLFADIVGFTSLSQKTSPEALVTMLNELFSMFDKLAEQHGLEKIKTIGDAYMVVAGIPQPVADHATALAHMALDMQRGIEDYAKQAGTPLSIRIGIHTGSVVAGVIGTKKFIYDLWGDTVNTASRMESTGLPGRIQVSESTAQLLKEQFELDERGPIEVKGKGTMTTYLLVRQRPDPERVSIASIASTAARKSG